MQMRKDTLDYYRDTIMAVVHGNNRALLSEDRMSDKQKADTALMMAAASASFAAGLMAKTEPRLINAPFETQLDDMLNLLREVLCKKGKPDLTLVGDEADG